MLRFKRCNGRKARGGIEADTGSLATRHRVSCIWEDEDWLSKGKRMKWVNLCALKPGPLNGEINFLTRKDMSTVKWRLAMMKMNFHGIPLSFFNPASPQRDLELIPIRKEPLFVHKALAKNTTTQPLSLPLSLQSHHYRMISSLGIQ